MKIAYILPSLQNQGPVIVAKSLVDYLTAKGCTVDVFYFDELPPMRFNCITRRITMNECINFDEYDIIHAHCLRPDRYVVKWKKNIHRAKLLTTLHQDTYRSFRYRYNPLLSGLLTWYWCRLQSRFDGVISISNQLKDIYTDKIKAGITTVYNGCPVAFDATADSSITDKLQSIKKEYKLLGAYAYVTRGKGLGQILQSLVYLPDYAFAVIGEGPDIDELKKMAGSLSISNRVFFFPYQKSPRNYLPYFDIYTMPSYSEGFGLSMIEAALAKLAIVCSDIPSFHEIFSSEEASFFEPDNIDSLQKAITTAYMSKNRFGESAYKKASENFTIQEMGQNHLAYYQRIML
jgi:glycosyltransferase involved in cell wall biosynthesis